MATIRVLARSGRVPSRECHQPLLPMLIGMKALTAHNHRLAAPGALLAIALTLAGCSSQPTVSNADQVITATDRAFAEMWEPLTAERHATACRLFRGLGKSSAIDAANRSGLIEAFVADMPKHVLEQVAAGVQFTSTDYAAAAKRNLQAVC